MPEDKFDPIEAEVNAIRLRIYEEIKDMTPEKEAHYFISRTDPIIKQFNLKMSDLKPVKPMKREGQVTNYSEAWWREQFGELMGIAER